MSSNVFYDGLNEFCRKYFVAGVNLTSDEIAKFPVVAKEIEATFFENLLLFDKVSLKVFGENIPLVMLLNLFGEKGLEELVEQGAIDFVLWTPMVLFLKENQDGIDPLCSGVHNSKVHSDPEESIEMGLGWMTKKLDRSKRRRLVRKLRDLYRLPDNNLSHDAVRVTKSAYLSGRLNGYGLNPNLKEFQKLDSKEKERLCTCAHDLLEYSYLLSSQMTSFSKPEFYEFFCSTQNQLRLAGDKTAAFCKVAHLEEFPNLKNLYPQIESPFQKILKVRNKRSSVRFREWLERPLTSNEGASEITKEYVDAIVNAKGFFQTSKGKITKTVAMSSIGAGIGAVLGGVTGSVAGATAAKFIEPAADVALDLVDEFLIDGLTKGWTPRMFIDDLRELRIER